MLVSYEEMLCKLLSDVFSNMHRAEETALFRSNIDASVSEVHLMDSVGRLKDATVSDIASDLKITLASVTIAVNKLASKGYIFKRRNPCDGRSVNIYLTKSGLRVYRLHRYFHRRMVSSITENMSRDEKNILYSGLNKLNSFLAGNAGKREET